MDDQEFETLRAELETDTNFIVAAIQNFREKWEGRKKKIEAMSELQKDVMLTLCERIDNEIEFVYHRQEENES